jgi:hypothetical protein
LLKWFITLYDLQEGNMVHTNNNNIGEREHMRCRIVRCVIVSETLP